MEKVTEQHAKKVMSDSPELVDFSIGLANPVEIFEEIQITEEL